MMIGREGSSTESVTALFCWELASAEPLRRLWLEGKEEKEGQAPDHETDVGVGLFDCVLNLLSKSQQEERFAS